MMRIPRRYLPVALAPDSVVALNADAAHHVARVLRMEVGAAVCLFNGEGGEYQAVLHSINKSHVYAQILSYSPRDAESPLHVTLAQGIPRGERMDYTLQKAVELGVARIAPLFSERCEVRLQGERLDKRIGHWQGIVISACEQCGRTRIPPLATPMTLQHWLSTSSFSGNGLHLVLDPRVPHRDVQMLREGRFRHPASGDTCASMHGAGCREQPPHSLAHCTKPADNNITLLIGPEGGLSDTEITAAEDVGFTRIRVGPRILRAETAGIAVLAALQSMWGDLR